jgi:hypothetical protein
MTELYNLCMTERRSAKSLMDFEALALFTADHAAEENGKVYVNGGFWNSITFPTYPARVAFSLVAVIRVPARAFLENHQITIEIVDADEERLPFRIDGKMRVGAPAHMKPGDPALVPMAFPLNGLTLQQAGDYWFVLSIDGNELKRYHVRAIQSVPVPQQLPFDAPDSDDAEEE